MVSSALWFSALLSSGYSVYYSLLTLRIPKYELELESKELRMRMGLGLFGSSFVGS